MTPRPSDSARGPLGSGIVAPFEFGTAGRIVFGSGRAAQLPSLVAGLGSRAFVCTGSRPDRHGELLSGLGLPTSVFAVEAEPTVAVARAATDAARAHGADLVVGVGGGSVVDLAKAVAMLLANGGEPLDYIERVGQGQPITRASVPYVAVPTTAGTGAEVTANAVLAVPQHQLKASLRSHLMIPRVALVDPLLTLASPPAVTASSGLDALTQCLEPFVSVRANPLTDAVAREGLARAAAGLRRAYADGSDARAREDMALCSLLGGMALANAKLGAGHGFAGPIGGTVDAPHGAVCAALLAPVAEANVKALRARDPHSHALARYAEAAQLLTGRVEATIEDGIDWMRETVALLGIPRLREFGLGPEHLDDLVGKAAGASSMQGNPVVLTTAELRAVLATAV